MTGRERLLATFEGKRVDRVPVAPFIHVNFVNAFAGSRDVDAIRATVDVHEHFGFDIIHRNCTPAYDDLALESDSWHVSSEVKGDGRDETTTIIIHTPKGDLRQVHRLVWVTEYDAEWTPVDYLIKSEDDLNAVMECQPPVPEIDVSAIALALDALGDKGVAAPWIQGAFNFTAYFYRSLDELVMDALTNPQFYHRTMRYFLDRNKRIVAQFADAGADLLCYGGNIASGKMVGEAFFREFVFPYEKELIDFIQSRGTHVFYHNCGFARNLFTAYKELGMHAYESLTAAPYGDSTLDEAFDLLGPNIVLSGNLDQIDFLRHVRPDEVKRCVEQVMEKAKPRGNFILGTSDYFNEDTPAANMHALAEAGREFGRY